MTTKPSTTRLVQVNTIIQGRTQNHLVSKEVLAEIKTGALGDKILVVPLPFPGEEARIPWWGKAYEIPAESGLTDFRIPLFENEE